MDFNNGRISKKGHGFDLILEEWILISIITTKW